MEKIPILPAFVRGKVCSRSTGKNPDVAGRLASDQFPRRAGADHDPAVENHDAVAEQFGFVHVVRGDERRLAGLPKGENLFPKQMPHRRVEPGRRFVQNQHLGVRKQRAHKSEPAFHAAGKRRIVAFRLWSRAM